MLNLTIRTINNDSYAVSVDVSDTVQQLKNKIKNKTDISETRQRLIYRGRVLEDDKKLIEYQIEDEHVVHLVLKVVNASATPSTPVSNERPASLEHIRQGVLSIRTVLSSLESSHTVNINSHEFHLFREKVFTLGQWLDVQDTVSQWLEATVMAVNVEEKTLLIHYNGWPVRWDEWIACSSPRLAPFRSHSTHANNTAFASPTPITPVANAPSTGSDDIRGLLPELASLIREFQPMLDTAADCARPGINGAMQRVGAAAGRDEIVATTFTDGQFEKSAGDICSLADRLGRVLVDVAPHLHSVSTSRRLGNASAVNNGYDGSLSPWESLARERMPHSIDRNHTNVEEHYRSPIQRSRVNGSGSNAFMDPSPGAEGSVPGLLNIHIAIISPPQRPTADNAISDAVASLQAQSESLAQQHARLQELRQQQIDLELQHQDLRSRNAMDWLANDATRLTSTQNNEPMRRMRSTPSMPSIPSSNNDRSSGDISRAAISRLNDDIEALIQRLGSIRPQNSPDIVADESDGDSLDQSASPFDRLLSNLDTPTRESRESRESRGSASDGGPGSRETANDTTMSVQVQDNDTANSLSQAPALASSLSQQQLGSTHSAAITPSRRRSLFQRLRRFVFDR